MNVESLNSLYHIKPIDTTTYHTIQEYQLDKNFFFEDNYMISPMANAIRIIEQL